VTQTDHSSEWRHGKAAELSFIEEGIRLLQRQREVFLGFAITVVAAVSLQVAKISPHPERHPNTFVFVLAAMVAIAISGWLIWRNSREILRAGIYAAIALERDIPGRGYQSGLHRLRVRHLEGKDKKLLSPANGASVGYAASLAALAAMVIYLWVVARQGSDLATNSLIGVPALAVGWVVIALLGIGRSRQLKAIIKHTESMDVSTLADRFSRPIRGDRDDTPRE